MEGIFFFWFAWIGWVWTVFMMDRSTLRTRLSVYLLMLMIASPYELPAGRFSINASALILICGYIIETSHLKKREFLHVFTASFIVMLGYMSFLLFELFDPVWLIFDRQWLIPLCVFTLAALIEKEPLRIYASIAGGMLQGEFVFSFVIDRISSSYTVASYHFLDVLSGAILLAGIWAGIQQLAASAGRHVNQGRGRQKSS